jgi:hypothetical protein
VPLPIGAPLPKQPTDLVDVSAFAPRRVAAREAVIVQVLLHVEDDAGKAKDLALKSDPTAEEQGVATLEVELARGQRVQVALEASDFRADETVQIVTWRGKPVNCQFLLHAPEEFGRKPVTVRVLQDGVPIGKILFSLLVAPVRDESERAVAMLGQTASRYSRAFLSYASVDRADVLKRADILRATRIPFFNDLLSLEPGEAWMPRLFEEIDQCDLFLLFWSGAAAKSEWVRKEAEHALRVRAGSPHGRPDIMPIILEGPPVPQPPDSLKDIHFNDYIRYVIAAIEADKGRASS